MNDYKTIIEAGKSKFKEIENKVLVDFLVHIVEPEFNIAYLVFANDIYAINGAVGSEVLTINKVHHKATIVNVDVKRFEPYSIFFNKKIIQVRSIGEEWNGHGFEINFKGMHERSMIVQSIYAGDKPREFHDCIRLGVGRYWYSSDL